MRFVPRLCEFNPGICLTTEERAFIKVVSCGEWKNNVEHLGKSTINFILRVKKTKFALEEATKAHKGIRGITLLFL